MNKRGAEMDKLNRLERAILQAEDSAEDARWAQAEEVVRRLDLGETQREVAASWANLRTGQSYSQVHVQRMAKIWRDNRSYQGQKPFSEIYSMVSNSSQAPQREAQAPRSVETAERLVQNLAKAPGDVQDAVFHGLREVRAGQYVPPAERKAREAAAHEATKPLRQAVGAFAGMKIVSLLDEAKDELREIVESDSLDAAALRKIERADESWNEELEVARATLGTVR